MYDILITEKKPARLFFFPFLFDFETEFFLEALSLLHLVYVCTVSIFGHQKYSKFPTVRFIKSQQTRVIFYLSSFFPGVQGFSGRGAGGPPEKHESSSYSTLVIIEHPSNATVVELDPVTLNCKAAIVHNDGKHDIGIESR